MESGTAKKCFKWSLTYDGEIEFIVRVSRLQWRAVYPPALLEKPVSYPGGDIVAISQEFLGRDKEIWTQRDIDEANFMHVWTPVWTVPVPQWLSIDAARKMRAYGKRKNPRKIR